MVIKASDFFRDPAWDKNDNSVTLHNSEDNVGIATIPSARLHLPAGTTLPYSAPLKFTPGELLDVEENGAVEFDGTKLYITAQDERKEFLFSTSLSSGTENYIPKFTATNNLNDSIMYQDDNTGIIINGELQTHGLQVKDPVSLETIQIASDSTCGSVSTSHDLELRSGESILVRNKLLFDNNVYSKFSTDLTNLGDSGMVRLQWTDYAGKPAIVWFDQNGDRQAAIVARFHRCKSVAPLKRFRSHGFLFSCALFPPM